MQAATRQSSLKKSANLQAILFFASLYNNAKTCKIADNVCLYESSKIDIYENSKTCYISKGWQNNGGSILYSALLFFSLAI